MRAQGYEPQLAPTTGPGTAAGIARRAIEDGAGLILACGGDGTVNEVAEGMIHSQVPLGVLPAGTANVLAVEISLDRTLSGAARHLPECVPRRIAVGRVWTNGGADSRHFLLMAGAGLDAQIVYRLNAALKDRAGKLAYWLSGVQLGARRLPQFEVTVEGVRSTCSFALVSRVRNYGGDFSIARDVSLLDDRFEVVLFQGRYALRYLPYLAGLVAGRVTAMPGVSVYRAREVCCQAPEDAHAYVQVDGEYAGRLPARMEMVPDALTLLLPPAYVRRFSGMTA